MAYSKLNLAQATQAAVLMHVFVIINVVLVTPFAVGKTYPISASWFRDRFTTDEWNKALDAFQSTGGNTIWLRAPPILVRTKQDILRDPKFTFCGSVRSPDEVGTPDCVSEAEADAKRAGLNVVAFATYDYEEDFSEKMLRCPEFDKKINSSLIYHRLMIPLTSTRAPCQLKAGDNVLILFTVYSGVDPHLLLVTQAAPRNISVYFGLPSAPENRTGWGDFLEPLLVAYYDFCWRIILDHSYRYKSSAVPISRPITRKPQSLYDVIRGYYSTNEVCLADVSGGVVTKYGTKLLDIYRTLGKIVHSFDKLFVISPYINLNLNFANYSLAQHNQGFQTLAATGLIDVIAVQEGRGCAKGCYYWPDERKLPIEGVDPSLWNIVRYLSPGVRSHSSFVDVFRASNQEVFKILSETTSALHKQGIRFQFWLNVESFEYVRDEPCLPVDPRGSGMAELINRSTKDRLDWALTVAGARVQKIITFAWDSDWTCVTRSQPKSLWKEVLDDINRPIIADCGWKDVQNKSVVVLGFNLEALQVEFNVTYPLSNGSTISERVYGYYYDLSYGLEHQLVDTLQYVRMYDLWHIRDLANHGVVTVNAKDAYHHCVFDY